MCTHCTQFNIGFIRCTVSLPHYSLLIVSPLYRRSLYCTYNGHRCKSMRAIKLLQTSKRPNFKSLVHSQYEKQISLLQNVQSMQKYYISVYISAYELCVQYTFYKTSYEWYVCCTRFSMCTSHKISNNFSQRAYSFVWLLPLPIFCDNSCVCFFISVSIFFKTRSTINPTRGVLLLYCIDLSLFL